MRDKCHAKLSSPFLVIICVLAATAPALCQTLTQDLPWYGTVQCDLNVQSSNYAHQETQTWTVAGGAPTVQGVIPATWSVSGQGSAQRLVNLQTANWKTNVAPISAPLRVFVRASDNRLIIKPWHTQLQAAGTTTGTRVSATGQVAVQYSAFEWLFPAIEDVANSTNVSGSGTVPVATSSLPLAPPGTTGTAVYKWQLSHVQHTLPGTPPAAIAAGVPPVARVVTTPARTPAGTPASTPASSNTQTPAAPPASTQTPGTVTTTPASGGQGVNNLLINLDLQGTTFNGGETLSFVPGITVVQSLRVNSPTSASVVVNIDTTAPLGATTYVLSTSAQSLTGTFTVEAAQAGCPAGQTKCGGTCSDLSSDINNCGGCGIGCSTPNINASQAIYSSSRCSYTCNQGFLDCNHGSDGCETRLVASTASCGCNVAHDNGLGQVYNDCTHPPGQPTQASTYNQQMATEAAAAFTNGGASKIEQYNCFTRDLSTSVVVNNSCAVWTYAGPDAGFVKLSSTTDCLCPTPTDGKPWN